jgi:hypothetical protein
MQQSIAWRRNLNRKKYCNLFTNQTGMTQRSVIPVKRFALRQSGGLDHKKIFGDFRSMTLRHQVSLILPFGQPVGLDQKLILALDAWLCVAVFWRFCFCRQSGGPGSVQR